MPSLWTNTVTAGSPIRAFDINELRDTVNINRSAYGLAGYLWTDDPVTPNTPIRAVHYTELRTAIQDLWTRKGMGTIPTWTVGTAPTAGRAISANDLNDLRHWLNSYETDTRAGVYGPLRGLHLRHGTDMRTADIDAAKIFDPGLVVVLSEVVNGNFPNTLEYLASLSSSVEIFCRLFPTTIPPANYTTFEGYNSWYTDGGVRKYQAGIAQEKTGHDTAQAIVDAYDAFVAAGLEVTRFYPGNEPELEWFDGDSALINAYAFNAGVWDDFNAYYRDIYHNLQLIKGNRPIELYPPAFTQQASVGIGRYNEDGTTTPRLLDNGEKGFDRVRSMIEYYTNGTQVGRVNWHNYFWPGRQNSQSTFDFMPQWLKDHITNDGYVSRVTEWGWANDCFDASGCAANLDTTTQPCSNPTRAINSWGDYNSFLRDHVHAGGSALWILSSPDPKFQSWAAVDGSGNIRTWFKQLVAFLNANL